jgi:hypothetical protein
MRHTFACSPARQLRAAAPASARAQAAVAALSLAALGVALAPVSTAPAAAAAAIAPTAHGARVRAICSGPNSAKVPCRFGTPSGNIRCIWTPHPNNVACVLRSTGRAYRLRPTGRAKAIRLTLRRHGQTLPLNQQLVFPNAMSCRDTRRTMICNQDFLTGSFTLSPHGSHRS